MFLGLTALEDFWDKSQPILFLGEWCRKYERKSALKRLNISVFQSSKLNYANSYDAYQHVVLVHERLLPKLAEYLNSIHQTKHSLQYWRLLVGPFLFWYMQVVYHRFLYLEAAFFELDDLETYGLSHKSFLTAMNTNEFMCLAVSDAWNLQIFTQLIDCHFKKPILYKDLNWETTLNARKTQFLEASLKQHTKFFINVIRVVNKFSRSQEVGILGGMFSEWDLLKLMLKSHFRILPLLPARSINRGQSLSRLSISSQAIDVEKRQLLLDIATEDPLSKLVINTLPINMPLNFIEGYHEEVEASKKYFPYKSRVILQEQVASYDQYKFWMGEQLEDGAKIIGCQHGGCYGMQKASSAEFLECYVSNFFVSWGWMGSKKIVAGPMPSSEHIKRYFRKARNEEYKEILWVATLYMRYPISIHDWVMTGQPYLTYQKRFFAALEAKIASDICMRLNPSFNNIDEVREMLPGLKVYSPKDRESFFSHLDRAKIVVIDNPSTTFLYALALNVPTVLFWDKKHWIFRDEAKPFLDMLEKTGIYHATPEAAAEMLNKVIDDPHSWWNSDEVQTARQQFCYNFARLSSNYTKEWTNILLDISRHSNIEIKAVVEA